MKDFVSKVTFGFLMAQLLPGALAIFSISSLVAGWAQSDVCVSQMILKPADYWMDTPFKLILFLFTAAGSGMLIHGLNWTVLAWIEYKCPDKKCVRDTWLWHKKPFWFQLLLSPLQMVAEIAMMLFAPNLEVLTTHENVPHLDSAKMPQFTFLQEFYLHFFQFYAHMAYAFLVATFCTIISCIPHFNLSRLALLVGIYFSSSVFFLLGRIQSGSLFDAERRLAENVNSSQG